MYSQEAAAAKVGIKRNTLRDYKVLIRTAFKFGFNFDANVNEPVGVLRSYVNLCNKKIKREQSPKPVSEFSTARNKKQVAKEATP